MPHPGAGAPAASRGGALDEQDGERDVLRHRSWPTLLLVLFCLTIGIPLTVALTPDQDIVALGQRISVGARPPELSVAGPARLVQVGNTTLDVDAAAGRRPAAPGADDGPGAARRGRRRRLRRRTRATGARRRGLGRHQRVPALVPDRGARPARLHPRRGGSARPECARWSCCAGRVGRPAATPRCREIWSHCVRAAGRMTAVAVVASVLAWVAAGGLAYAGAAQGLRNVSSLSQLVGAYHLSPDPVGPPVTGYDGAVIGDSRATRVGGPPRGRRFTPTTSPASAAPTRSPPRSVTCSRRACSTSPVRAPRSRAACAVPQERAGGLRARAGRPAQTGAGPALRRGGDRPERRGLDRLRALLLRRPRLRRPAQPGRVRLPDGGVRPRLR